MDIHEMSKEKRQLEILIRNELQKMFNDFEDRTGITPCNVNIDLVGMFRVSESQPRYYVNDVSVTIKV